MKTGHAIFAISLLLLFGCSSAAMEKLQLSSNKRFLVKEDGSPFVWIGDTHWFFAKLPPSTIDQLLDRRSSQGFTVMSISCRENLYNGDGPGEISNLNETWWSYLDDYIAKCERRNLYVAITLGWWGIAARNSANALYEYGRWVGHRYRDSNNIIWLTLGEAGSHRRGSTIPDGKLEALVRGIRDGDTGNKLLSIHADYQRGTSLTNDGEICDFNNWQTSQWCCVTELPRMDPRSWTVWEAIQFDYQKLYHGKPKPTIDAEGWYENNKDFCGATAFAIRRRAYFTIFAGAFGHTYGAGGIWDGLSAEQGCSKGALESLEYPGAEHIGFLSKLLHGLGDDFLKLHPDQEMILDGNSDCYDRHIQASVSGDGDLALIYSASDSPYRVDLSEMSGEPLVVKWFDPRHGRLQTEVEFLINEKAQVRRFDPPGEMGAGNDWVLLLEVANPEPALANPQLQNR